MLDIENLGKRSAVIGTSITNRMQEVEEKILGPEDTIVNIDTRQKAPNCKHPENSGHSEKTKPKDNRYRIERRFPS